MFKRILVVVLGACAMFSAQHAKGDDYVRGYYRSNGTYVAPHYRSTADGNFYNNWSTYPNVNPYTGKMGTRVTPPYSSRIPTYTPRSSFPSYRLPSYSPRPSFSSSHGWRR
jgi:hypothetical protein